MSRRVAFWLAVGIIVLMSSTAFAQSKTIKMTYPLRLLWVVEETVDGVKQDMPLTPSLWKGKLEKLNFISLATDDNAVIASGCPVDGLMEKKICSNVMSVDADLIIGGRVTATSREGAPSAKMKGIDVQIDLKVFSVDSGKHVLDLEQKTYGTGANMMKALGNALKKVSMPMAIRFSNLVQVRMRGTLEGELRVTGFGNRDQAEELLGGLRQVAQVTRTQFWEYSKDATVYRIGFNGTSWYNIVDFINKRQGAGVSGAKVTGTLRAEGAFDAARAFRLMVGVTEIADKAKGAADAEKRELVAKKMEEKVSEVDYFTPAVFPVRLSGRTSKAKRVMKDEHDGDLFLAGTLKTRKGDLQLIVEVWSTFAGRLFTVTETIVAGEYDIAIGNVFVQIKEKLPDILKKKRRNIPKFKRSLYDAWAKTN